MQTHSRRSVRHPARIGLLAALATLLAIGGQLMAQSPRPAEAPAAEPWRAAEGPLFTRWGRQVTPSSVHGEYPRPQMTRPRWQSLNGLWQIGFAKDAAALTPGSLPEPARSILVPFPPESALSGLMMPAARQYLHYRRTFEIPADWKGSRILLHFGAVDYHARVLVNGRQVAEHTGGFDPFSADITDALGDATSHTLEVLVTDESDATDQPRGKQVLNPEGIWYTPTSGIWQTVWLEPVAPSHLTGLTLTPDLAAGTLRVSARASAADESLRIRATVLDGGRVVARSEFAPDAQTAIVIPAARRWSPESPFLYDLQFQLVRGEEVVDAVTSYFGMRSIEVRKDDQGVNRLFLNGAPVFQVGPLDQGFWPDGLYTAPSDEALRYDLELTKKLGFNMVRKHVKVEPARWYYHADKLGLLVWQDMPSGNNATPAGRAQFERELEAMIDSLRNHPSIIMWVVFNEGWGQYDTERVCAQAAKLDPTRLINNASGWTDKGVGHVIDAHAYPDPAAPKLQPDRAAVLGEYGGLGLPIDGHRWKSAAWGYQNMRDADHLTRRYGELMRAAYKLADDAGLCAAVYTQITDVELECNGLYTYDRAVTKIDESLITRANRGDFAWLPERRDLLAAADTAAAKPRWKFTTSKPADDWSQPDFDDRAWNEGASGFGTHGTPGSHIGTEWNSPEIYLRREFTLEALVDPAHLWLWLHHDEDAEVYINGHPAGTWKGYTTGYIEAPIAPDAAKSLKPGRNVIAIRCRQTTGGQYIDAGLIDLRPAAR